MKKKLALLFLVAIGNLLVYRQVTDFQPINLDEQQLLSGRWEYLKSDSSFTDAFKHDVFEISSGAFYRPVLTISFILDSRLSGDKFDPSVFHRTNLWLHILNALLCFLLLSRLGYAGELAAAGALIFSLHPALTGAVGWIPGRNDSLLFFFSVLALLFLTEAAKRRNAGLFILHLVSFLLALLTKETAVVLLAVFPVWHYVFLKDADTTGRGLLRTAALAALGWGLCAGVYLLLRNMALHGGNTDQLPDAASFLFRMAAYVSYMIFPADIPGYAWFEDLSVKQVLLINAAGAAAFAAAWRLRKGWILPCAAAATLMFIFPSAFSNRFLPHRLYLPVFFFALAAVEAAVRFHPANRLKTLACLAAAIAVMGSMTFHSLARFKDPVAFWSAAYATSPSCGEAAYELGYSAQLRGDLAAAEKYYREVISGSPQIPDARTNLGVIYKQAGKYEEALRLYEGELQLTPGKPLVLENIGNLMAAQGKWEQAIVYYKRKIAAEPEVLKTYNGLIFCLVQSGNPQEAAQYRRLISEKTKKPQFPGP